MQKKYVHFRLSIICTLFIFLGMNLQAQLNIDSLSHVDYQLLHEANLNDVWGYVDELGNEYAIVGTSKGTSIVNITDGSNPQEIFWFASPRKSFEPRPQNVCYICQLPK